MSRPAIEYAQHSDKSPIADYIGWTAVAIVAVIILRTAEIIINGPLNG